MTTKPHRTFRGWDFYTFGKTVIMRRGNDRRSRIAGKTVVDVAQPDPSRILWCNTAWYNSAHFD